MPTPSISMSIRFPAHVHRFLRAKAEAEQSSINGILIELAETEMRRAARATAKRLASENSQLRLASELEAPARQPAAN